MKKYMVMECHLSYAVVLDEEGRFLKVANRHYEVGQIVTDVFEMQIPQPVTRKKANKKWLYSLSAIAACMILVLVSIFQIGQMTHASVYMTINPEVRIDVNRKNVVVDIDGLNEDGDDLIEGYTYKKKKLDLVMDELVDRAIDMGYLKEGGRISLMLDSDNDEWIDAHIKKLNAQLNRHLDKKLKVTIVVVDKRTYGNKASIPVVPGGSDYSDYYGSDYGDSDYGDSDYDDSDYGGRRPTRPTGPTSPSGSVPSADDSDYSDYDDGQTDYDDSDYDSDFS
ncbi:MAG TPA: hypothetical protein GX736_00615 [Mogibacterium sp.]|nr:hypothetical protein [Mogibacterium sp.]